MEKENRNSIRISNNDIVKDVFFIFKNQDKKANELLEFQITDISHNGLRGKVENTKSKGYTIEKGLKLPIRVTFNNNKILNITSYIAWAAKKDDCIEFGLHFVGSIW